MRLRTGIAAFIPLVVLLALLPAASVSAAGLLVPNERDLQPLRITEHSVSAEIHDRIALSTIRQTFHNDTGRRLEATYVFPLPEDADITDFQMTFNGKMVQGDVLPAEEARTIYESIVRQARDPGLIEFIGRRLLQMRVFPIEPNSDTTIEVRYQQICRPTSGMVAYHYPLRTRKAAGQVDGTVRFNVNLQTTTPLKNVWSPSHSVEVARDGEHHARIGYEASSGSLNEDFVLLYGTDSSDLGMSLIAHQSSNGSEPTDDGHFVLMLTPKQLWEATTDQPQDIVFVLDTSGSMAGDKIAQARRALTYCIDSLDEHDRFSVVRFSTGFDVLWETPTEATRDHRAEALKWVAEFKAAGGTNIGDTLAHVVSMRREVGETDRPFVVVFLTDGMGNRQPDQILAMLKDAGGDSNVRLFPFGVGHDVHTVMLDRLAENHAGRPTYVQPGENLELIMGDFFSVISQPVLTNLKLMLPDAGVTEQFPPILGDLYHGQQVVVAGRFSKPVTGNIKLSAMRNGEHVEFSWPNSAFVSTTNATYVAPVWAGRKIGYMIDQIRRHGETPEMVQEVVDLGQRYGLQTPYTSWLVNPEGLGGDRPVLSRRARLGERAGIQRSLPALRSAGAPSSTSGGGRLLDESIQMEDALDQVSGESAVKLAIQNKSMRESQSTDGNRINKDMLAERKIGDRWYQRVSGYMVDATIEESDTFTNVRFASTAYFELLRARPDLKDTFAASRAIVVRLTDGQAVIITPDEGIEEFSDEHREQLKLAGS